jgi:hypothetical protein
MQRVNDFQVVSAFAAKSNEIKNDLLLDVSVKTHGFSIYEVLTKIFCPIKNTSLQTPDLYSKKNRHDWF